MLSLRGGPLEVRSAGLIDKWVAGGTAHPSMIAAASDCGYDFTGHRPAQVDKTLIDWADLVLAMDRSVLAKLHTIGGAESTAKVQLYVEDQDVPDPMGKPTADFAACAAIIEAGSARYLPLRIVLSAAGSG
ncbi:low molecular weight phosphotyrosine protein phosphatase [Streptomyces sp. NPDC056713]|uniref:arsenate reductase/protein-tyrosine-phosphatase family protein n=1 Tax=Streptomyces sp. NPDC056713 TaxID=3345921 RepID=UPI003691EE18